MLSRLRTRLTFANVVSAMALFAALGLGTAWALERDSVKSKHIVNDQVKSADVRDDSLPGGGLTGQDIREDTLDTVPSAADADTLDGLDSSDFEDADVTHNSDLKSLAIPNTDTTTTTPVLTVGSYHFEGTCQFAGQEAYANIRVVPDGESYLATEADGGRMLSGPLTFDQATIPLGGGNAEAGKTRSFTAIGLDHVDDFQGTVFYAILEEYDLCFFAVSGVLG